MYSTVTKTNAFFRDASRPQVDELMKNLVLTERQTEIFELYYIKRHDRGFVAVKVASLHTNGNGDSNAETPEIENEENKPSMDTEKTPPPNGTAVENTAMPQSVSAQPTR